VKIQGDSGSFPKRLDGILNALSIVRGNQQMNSKRSLMTALVGLAMLATPITAAAYDNNYNHNKSHAERVASSVNSTRSFAATRNFNHSFANTNAFHGNAVARHDFREERRLADANAYRNYGRGYAAPGYYGAPAYAAVPAYGAAPYAAAPYYGGNGGGGGGCGAARSVVNNYYRDRNTGHPAAAYDLLAQNRWAFRSGCTSGATTGGGMLSGLGGLGGLGRGYNGGGYNQPYGGGYNGGGYNQPYGGGSMLSPLLQYIR
jgi:hypothetical protein